MAYDVRARQVDRRQCRLDRVGEEFDITFADILAG